MTKTQYTFAQNSVSMQDMHQTVGNFDKSQMHAAAEFQSVVDGWILPDADRISSFLKIVRAHHKELTDMEDQEVLQMFHVQDAAGMPTLAGLLVFSAFPQAVFPRLCITAIACPFSQKGEMAADGVKFLDNQKLDGQIQEIVTQAMHFVKRNTALPVNISEDSNVPASITSSGNSFMYPLSAVREAIVNALVHREYGVHAQSIPVSIEIYPDRLEVTSPGGLYGMPEIRGDMHGMYPIRNIVLSNLLEIMGVARNRDLGMLIMQQACARAGLPDPQFVAEDRFFKVVFYANKTGREST